MSALVPELAMPPARAVFDGELIAFGRDHLPSFPNVCRRPLPTVIDERIVVAASFNHTEPANAYNDENLFVLGSTHAEVEGVEVEADPCRQLARHLVRARGNRRGARGGPARRAYVG